MKISSFLFDGVGLFEGSARFVWIVRLICGCFNRKDSLLTSKVVVWNHHQKVEEKKKGGLAGMPLRKEITSGECILTCLFEML